MSEVNDPEVIARLVATPARWAVVGLGDNPERAAHRVSGRLIERGFEVVPVHPSAATVHGIPGHATLAASVAAVGVPDVVDCFVNGERVGAVVDEAIAVGAGAVWLQLDVIDDEAAARALAAGLDVVMDRCPVIEWSRSGA